MNLHVAMTVFVAVAEQGGFAPAARTLGISTSAVSRHVQELEQELGAQLLRRSTRKLSLTEAGEIYLPSARLVIGQIRDLHEEIASLSAAPRGKLRITASPGFGDHLLSPVATRFVLAYPEITLEMDFTTRLVDLVAEGYDAGIRSGALRDSSLTTRRLGVRRHIACASPSYLAERGVPQRPGDLACHDCVHWRWRAGAINWSFHDGDEIVDVPVSGRYMVTSVAAEREGALAGLGVALLQPDLIAEDLASGRLVRVLENNDPVSEPLSIVWPAAAITPRKLRVFVDFLTKELVGLLR